MAGLTFSAKSIPLKQGQQNQNQYPKARTTKSKSIPLKQGQQNQNQYP
jgi:hypothetical protein